MTLRKLARMVHGHNKSLWAIHASLTASLMQSWTEESVNPAELMPDEYRPPPASIPPSLWPT